MAGNLLSAHWYAVANLKPRLAPQAILHRRRFRGRLWYVLQDPASGRFHRLTPAAYAIIADMDGRNTVQQLWERACRRPGEALPSQEDVVQLLSQLHASDILLGDLSPVVAELQQRHRKQQSAKRRQQFLDPLGLRWTLWNPDRFLERWSPRLAWMWGRIGILLWLVTVVPALALAAVHWHELTDNISDRVLNAQNLLALWLIYPLVKLLHELGHGLATKAGGGRVHELGVMLLALTPVPFVDASSSYAFTSKWQRAMVGAAGIFVETWIASVAMFVWVLIEPGLVRAGAYNVMVIAGISTLLVNGNPLMRYDGYHVMVELLEIPNLAMRGARYWTYVVDRYLFRAPGLDVPDESVGERFWLLLYMPLSFVYRILITISLVWYLAGKYFFFGVLLACWALVSMVGMPVWKGWRHVVESPTLARNRDRALKVAAGAVLSLLVVLVAVPMPFMTQAEGVVWLPESQIVRAGESGFVKSVFVNSGETVRAGSPVALLTSPTLEAELAQAKARLDELRSRYRDSLMDSPTAALVSLAQLKEAEETVRQDEARVLRLWAVSQAPGQFLLPDANTLPGRYFKRGDIVGYISRPAARPVVRVLVSQDDIDLVRKRTEGASIRFAFGIPQTYEAQTVRVVPEGQDQLPSKSLGTEGGGHVATDPRDPNGTHTLQRYFQLDLQVAEATQTPWYGCRVYVRFDHGYAPLIYQGYLRLRQLFLARLNV